MKICVYGAGAIGGYLGLMLQEGGADVSLIARGAHLAAIRKKGLTVKFKDGDKHALMKATDDPNDLGVDVRTHRRSPPGLLRCWWPESVTGATIGRGPEGVQKLYRRGSESALVWPRTSSEADLEDRAARIDVRSARARDDDRGGRR